MNPYYTDYSEYLQRIFPGIKVQKISLNAGLSCPNRDGTLGTGGCTYCNNHTFNPDYCHSTPDISEQLRRGKEFFARKYPQMKYLAYFQAYTNTYGDRSRLMAMYREALEAEDVVGLIIGTRPDCMPDSLLSELAEINKQVPVIIEYGAETSHDHTLEAVNRHHTWHQVEDAVRRTHRAGISCGLHLICGLPGESIDDILTTTRRACQLPIDTLKFHQLQIVKGSTMARQTESGEMVVKTFEVDDYIDLCVEIVRIVPRSIAIERFVSQAPADLLIAPRWGLKNYQFTNLLHNRLKALTQ
ncbi:MAG: TIGR01212 family radical SAM protein [Muribaculaceae bacterium]|nr:TIGR01212 family radical SAM protein [Muribaculaceae bacterium]